MAFKITDTGVLQKTGRGRNAVSIELSFAAIEKWARRMEIDEKRLWNRSYGRAVSGLKAKFYDVMKHAGGVLGVPKFKDFEEFTKQLRVLDGKEDRPMGGVLADRRRIVAFKRNGYQVIGWPDALSRYAIAFQDGAGVEKKDESFVFWPSNRYALHRKGIRDIPRVYRHNPRNVIPDPFCDYVRAHLDEWARGAYFKELAREMSKRGDFK